MGITQALKREAADLWHGLTATDLSSDPWGRDETDGHWPDAAADEFPLTAITPDAS